jgi:hypothetical protein
MKIPSQKKKRDMAWLEEAKASRACLKTFGDKARMMHQARLENLKSSEEYILVDLAAMSYDCSPEHLREQGLEYDAVMASLEAEATRNMNALLLELSPQQSE